MVFGNIALSLQKVSAVLFHSISSKSDDRKRDRIDSIFGGLVGYMGKLYSSRKETLEDMEDCNTNLVSSIAGETSQGTLNRASGRVDVRFERRGLVVRHIWW